MERSTSVLAETAVLIAGTADWTDPLAGSLAEAGAASVDVAPTVEETMARVSDRSVDCVVAGYELDDGTGIELVESVRGVTNTLPVVVATDAGSEAIASEAVGAGASDYVALSDPRAQIAEIADRLSIVVRDAQRTETLRDRAHQFDAIFQETRTATWVLDAAGRLQRANRTAREMVDADITDVSGEPFWALPWWPASGARSDVRRVVEDVRETESTRRVVMHPVDDERTVIELTVLPVHDLRGELVAVVVDGNDVTERVSLYRELQASEELHRVTLNNMTDTILMTDDSGAFTYVCPNVHYIFGYTAEEIREFGTIHELLGPDLFDREEVAEEGPLRNIETRATDKAGDEHVLLVNVREVDIGEGTLLFSCRDITERKQREEALTTLQETARRIQYAETKEEVAQLLAEDATDILDLPGSLISLHDPDDNTLRPVAYSDRMATLHGPLSAVSADESSLAGYSFVQDYPRFYDDVRESDWFTDGVTDLRSAAFVPIADHGMLVVGSRTRGAFDKIRRELTDLVAATAEAAFDRVDRDSRLRAQEQALKRQNRQLERLDELNKLIRDIDQALVRAETPAEVDQMVPEVLTDSTDVSFAWIGELDPPRDGLDPSAWAGDGERYLDAVDPTLKPPGGEPSARTAATREVTVVPNVADGGLQDEWERAALRRGFRSVISVPLLYDEFLYGVLTVYADAPDTFDDRVRETFAELGETIASAIGALNRKNALLQAAGTRLEFEADDPGFILQQLARRADCSITFEGGVQQTDEGIALFVTAESSSVEDLVAEASAMVSVADAQVLARGDEEGRVRLTLSGPFIGGSLADHGAILQRVEASASGTRLVVDVPSNNDAQPIVGHVVDALAGADLAAKYTEDRTPTHELYSTFLEEVTDRQLEVVETAYYSGFFESPRERSGEEIAATLDISGPAFYDHTRTVERKLFETLFDEIGVPAPAATPE